MVSIDPVRKEKKEVEVKDNLVVGPVKLFTLDGAPLEELNFENKFINELWIRDFDNEIICGGFTSNYDNSNKGFFSLGKSVFNNSDGIVIFKFNIESGKSENHHIKIPEEILNFYKNKKDVNQIENLYIHDFEIKNQLYA